MCSFLEKKQNAPRPSEPPPVRGKNMSKRVGGILGCKDKTSSWHLNDFPYMVVTLSQQCNVGEEPTVINIYLVYYKGSGRGGLSPPLSSVVGNALVVIDDGMESVNVKNRYQGARVSARRANREAEDGIRWKFVHGRVVVVR